jgi:hypothetical protein
VLGEIVQDGIVQGGIVQGGIVQVVLYSFSNVQG